MKTWTDYLYRMIWLIKPAMKIPAGSREALSEKNHSSEVASVVCGQRILGSLDDTI